MLNIARHLLNTVLKVKDRMVVWAQNGCKCISWCGWLGAEAVCLCSASQESTVPNQGTIKIKNSKYSFHWMHITHTPLWSWKIFNRTTVSQGPPVYTSYLQFFLGLGCWNRLNQQPPVFRITSEQQEHRFKSTRLLSQSKSPRSQERTSDNFLFKRNRTRPFPS